MELKQYAIILRRWAWLIVLCTLLGGAAAFGASHLMVPVYEASTTLLINPAPASRASPDYTSLLTSERLAETYAELLRTRPVLDEVITRLGLGTDAETLVESVSVTPVRDTQLIVITVEDPNPQLAADIANEIVAVFVVQHREIQAGRYAASEQNLQQELEQIQSDIDRTQASLDAIGDPITAEQVTERDRLDTLLAQYRSSYATVLESLEEVRLAEAQATDDVSIVEEAQPGGDPVRPRTSLNTVLVATLGGLVAVGVAFLTEYLGETVRSNEEIEALIGASTLSVIARIEGKDLPDKLVTTTRPRSPVAEAYRVLRANIELSTVDQPIRALLVSSAGPLEGKSTTVANLAIAIAQSGKRIILVDTDLRRPTLHKLFQQTNKHGVTTALFRRDGVRASDHLVSTGLGGLLLMPSGPLPPNPAELLGSRRMAELVEELKSQADIVLFDSPPLLPVADATLLASLCDAALLVVLAANTRADALVRAKEQLTQSGTRLLGVVLNRVGTQRDGYYYYYHYYYPSDRERSR